MAGSYNHCITKKGQLRNPESLAGMLENGGDVYEAVEEMFGMIWYLADRSIPQPLHASAAELVEIARAHYTEGLKRSPGVKD